MSAARSDTDYVTASKEKLQLVLQQTQKALSTTPNEALADQLLQLQDAVNALELLNLQLPHGTLDYSRCATSPELKQKFIRLTDGNSDTFAEYMDPRNGALSFDFGDGFQVAADAFYLQGRLKGASLVLGSGTEVTGKKLKMAPASYAIYSTMGSF